MLCKLVWLVEFMSAKILNSLNFLKLNSNIAVKEDNFWYDKDFLVFVGCVIIMG